MSPRLSAALAIAAWLCAPAGARADLVRAAGDRDHVVVVRDNQVRRSLDGGPAETIVLPPDSWVLDALPDRSGAVWIAIGPIPRRGPVRLGRAVAGIETAWRETAGTDAVGELHLVPRRRGPPLLVDASGAWRIAGDGVASRVASWSVDGYGFHAASARATPDGGVDVLAPTFDTCGSTDVLEGLVELGARGGRVTTRAWAADRLGYRAPALAADGTIYRWFRDARGACTIERGSAATAASPGEACDVMVRHDGRRTVAVIDGGRVVRLGRAGASRAIELGRLDPADAALDVSPDHRGGAIVLLADGRVIRFRGGAGQVLAL